ncbi:MAG TPA: porin [Terriglobales bacterium]
MKNVLCGVVLTIAICASVVPALHAQSTGQAQPTPAELSRKVEELEQVVQQLRSELDAVKKDHATGPPSVAEVASTSMPPLPATVSPALQDAAASAPSAPEKPSLAGLLGPTTLSGFVDVFYGYNSNQPASRINAFHNFDINSSQVGINMIELVADKPVSSDVKVGYHVALGFGQAMNQVNATEIGPGGTEPNFAQYLKEGYLEYMAPVGKGLQINVGKFVTPAGAEVIETKDNWNYTRGILFAWAIPYFHTGLSAKYAFSSKFALTGYLVNGWNNSTDNNSGKTTGFSAAITPSSRFGIVQNYLVGPEGSTNGVFRHLSDTVVTFNPTSKLSLMANYDYGHDSQGPGAAVWWSGIAGYIKYAPDDKWAFATRGEWFNDHNGFETATGVPLKLSEFTFTAQRMLAGKLMSRLEFRRDMADQNVFPYRDGTLGLRDNQNTVTLGLVYAFTSADAK